MLANAESDLESLSLVRRLLVAARLWSTQSPVDLDSVASIRQQLLMLNHARHLTCIPAYDTLATELGMTTQVTWPDLHGFVISDDWFKSYDQRWLTGDFAPLTDWLGRISTVSASLVNADELFAWRAALRQQHIYVTISSGTTGQPSLVPRDSTTLAALRSSSGVRLPWALPDGTYDCLLLTAPGLGSGIQSGAAGLAARARVSRQVDDPDSFDFLRAAGESGRSMIVYGTPARLHQFLEETALLPGALTLPAGSCVLTGGGWKQDTDRGIIGLLDVASATWGVDRERCVDTYSAAELNTVFVSCRDGRYHIPPTVEAVVVDELLQPVSGDADGRLAVFDSLALSFPGRLATRDHVRLRHDPCTCGLTGQTLLAGITRRAGAPERGCGVADVVVPT